ncbi:ribonuclease P protein component [bacterium]|nr:ribonuclease P protein component [bacterium]
MRSAVRLRKSQDFKDVRSCGRRASDRLLTLGIAPSDRETTRFGLSVSKRVGGAVTRNRVKRRLRECLSSLDIIPGHNLVVSARPAAAQADYHMLMSSLRRLAGQVGALRPDTAGLTEQSDNRTVNESASRKEALERKTI